MRKFESGAVRDEDKPRYDLIPHEGLRRLAQRYTMGAAKYGEWNWEKGLTDPEFLKQAKCHMVAHMWEYFAAGNEADDNLAAIAWGCMTLMEAEKRHEADRGGKDTGIGGARPLDEGPSAGIYNPERGIRGGR